jgi:hypothetical protein
MLNFWNALLIGKTRLRQRLGWVTAGGLWTQQLPAVERRSLRFFWFDGLFSNASEAIIVSYQTLFVLALGATSAQIGLLNAVAGLSAARWLLFWWRSAARPTICAFRPGCR